MDAIDCILTRRTALSIVGPEPDPEQLELLVRAATTAPDHKLVRPWRFVVVRGEHRQAVADAFAEAAATRPDSTEDAVARQGAKPLRAPAFIAVIASPRDDGPVPRWEQLASAAAAAQNICLAAHALGLASAWKSTPMGDAPPIMKAFAMTDGEELLGWIDVGHAADAAGRRPRADVELGAVASELIDGELVPFGRPTAGSHG